MPKKMLIDATHPEETRVVVADGQRVEEFDFESEAKRQLAGNIYLAKVTRVEPSLQAAFVEYGGNRHGFLAFAEIHPDYYQIPTADREALIAEEEAAARDAEDEARREEERTAHRASEVGADDPAEAPDDDEAPETIGGDGDGDGGAERPEDVPLDADDHVSAVGGAVAEAAAPEPTLGAEVRGMETVESSDGGLVEDTPEAARDGGLDDAIEPAGEGDDVAEITRRPRPKPRRYKIQEVVKVRQIMLVQVVKEERGNKGAALTTYLSLAGRYCVLMPNTARGGGISRKITQAADRKKLKEIASEIEVPRGAGLIIRTAGAKRTKAEIKRDYEYLQRLWEQVRELTLKSVAPAKIYEEGDLIKRTIRDLYNRDIEEVVVDGERGFRTAREFMAMIMPSHAKNVRLHEDGQPLFARHGVETTLGAMFNPTVQLPSGGYIVIGVTEALVAIDVNSGRATKKGSIEETALQTNLEAAEEVARQAKLRDLAGLIVIDFIDMDDRRNNAAVEKRLKERLKSDRARIQVGRISGFGLLEMSRQRMRPGMIEATTQPCQVCHGTGLIRSDDSLALTLLRQVEEEAVRGRSAEVLVRAPVGAVNYLFNHKREHLAGIEGRHRMAVRLEADAGLVSPDFSLERFKTRTRAIEPVRPTSPVVSGDASLMDDLDADAVAAEEQEAREAERMGAEGTDAGGVGALGDEAPVDEATGEVAAERGADRGEEAGDDDGPRRKRRRRRRRRSGEGEARREANGADAGSREGDDAPTGPVPAEAAPVGADAPAVSADQEGDAAAASVADGPGGRTVTRRRRTRSTAPRGGAEAPAAATPVEPATSASEPAPAEPIETATTATTVDAAAPEADADADAPRAGGDDGGADEPSAAPLETKSALATARPIEVEPAEERRAADGPSEAPGPGEAGIGADEPAEAPAPAAPPKPKRRGWWSLGR